MNTKLKFRKDLIIRPQAFGRLRPVSFLLGLINFKEKPLLNLSFSYSIRKSSSRLMLFRLSPVFSFMNRSNSVCFSNFLKLLVCIDECDKLVNDRKNKCFYYQLFKDKNSNNTLYEQ